MQVTTVYEPLDRYREDKKVATVWIRRGPGAMEYAIKMGADGILNIQIDHPETITINGENRKAELTILNPEEK